MKYEGQLCMKCVHRRHQFQINVLGVKGDWLSPSTSASKEVKWVVENYNYITK